MYWLKPRPNPNPFDACAEAGQKIFERERCARCHTPPLYTSNKVTLAERFTPPGMPQRAIRGHEFGLKLPRAHSGERGHDAPNGVPRAGIV